MSDQSIFPDLIQEFDGRQDDFLGDGNIESIIPISASNSSPNGVSVDGSLSGAAKPVKQIEDYLRYSEILSRLPPTERKLVIETVEEAIRRGTVRAVPLAGERFTVRYGLATAAKRRTVQDYQIKITTELQQWLEKQVAESRYASMAESGHVTSTVERLVSGTDDFDRMAEMYRQQLRSKARGIHEQ